MPHVEDIDGIESFLLADNADDMLDMHEAAQMVEGVAVEILPRDSQEDRTKAITAYRDLALAINIRHRNGHVNPEGWAHKAHQVMEAGGYVVRLHAMAIPERPAETNLSLFYTALGGIRRADTLPPFEGSPSKDDSTHNI